ncbi:MAG: asparagine synthase (glutamine-hydrolyzing), partial [Chlamydiota bacterium]|nr:asparagine synthase (glutamine-hydrolyzing) [Chlamydiota bacterium]
GRQPMSNLGCPRSKGPVWVVYNGEIYNFPDIRRDLEQKGHRFTSHCDTEVILHAYEEEGIQCVHRFNGMFAFALWDSAKKELYLVRDRLGIKPLYYYVKDGKLIFASEIKAILKSKEVSRQLNPASIYRYLGYEFVPAPDTMFRDIKKLEGAHYIKYSHGVLEKHRYWDISFHDESKPQLFYVDKIAQLLEESVRKRLISDVPVGVFLSGGLDSSTVVAYMNRHVKEPLKTFTIGYEDPSYSELEYARAVSKQFNTIPTELIIDPITMMDVEKAVWHLDEPMTDLSTVPFMMICRKAREQVKVCLSGEGGDEIFLGYDRFKASKFNQAYQMIPRWLRHEVISKMIGKLPDQDQKKGLINVMKRFVEGSDLPDEGLHMRWQYFLDPHWNHLLFGETVQRSCSMNPFEPIRDILKSCHSSRRLDREQYVDLRFTMPESVLMKVDKMSMATALEVRVPFLDHEFIEFCASIPNAYKLQGFSTKAIFRSALKGVLPDTIRNRGKQGYSLPIKNWIRNELKDYMRTLLNESPVVRDYLKIDFVNTLIQQHTDRTHNHNHVLWALINMAVWHKLFILEEFS